ncbi:class I SAM-dependent methyltransferase, partial [Candidatus Contendibacter odensensis]|uniref:class I SAM-dependent methyltransferase n=1 Tax=Candidatus Contendibacter odensensis TaxID=1400860 RepID=UPI000685896B
MKNWLESSVFTDVNNPKEFCKGIQHVVNQINGAGVFLGDNLFTYGKNLSFLDDEKFMEAFTRHAKTNIEQSIIWRFSILTWAALRAMQLEGDFIECACYKGTSARIVCDYVDFMNCDKKYYLYDSFEHNDSMIHHGMPELGTGLYETVCHRFSDVSNVVVTQGLVPQILHEVSPEKIAFMHIDLNNAPAEVGALELLFDRMTSGAVLVLDDYGWLSYRAQKIAEDEFFGRRGYIAIIYRLWNFSTHPSEKF